MMVSPTAAAEQALNSTYVKFSLLALSSIFFLVDPFAAIPSFIAITADVDPARRRRMAWKAALTCFIVLISFALAGQFIFSLFGIKLPAFGNRRRPHPSPHRHRHDGSPPLPHAGIAGRDPGSRSQRGRGHRPARHPHAGRPRSHLQRHGPRRRGPGPWAMLAILGSITITAFVSYVVLAAPIASGSFSARPASASWSASWDCCWSLWPCSSSLMASPISA